VRKKQREAESRIAAALGIAADLAGYDGGHHKAHCIDQMVRALTGCPTVVKTAVAHNGKEYSYETLGEGSEYFTFKRDNPDWDEGIAP
jgi:hypothetical protein